MVSETKDTRVVLLGGAGFIGSHLAEELLSKGYRVRVFGKTTGDWSNIAAIADRVERVQGDFHNEVDVRRALEHCEIAVHLVASTVPATSNLNPFYDVETNLVPTLRMLDVARSLRVRRLCFISSGGTVYGRAATIPIPEDHPTEPLCSYGITKLAIEKYIALYRQLFGVDFVICRLSNPYGERQRTVGAQGAVAVFLARLFAGQPIEIWGDGSVVRDYVYVKDAVRAIRLVLEQNSDERIFNVGSQIGMSLNDLVRQIQQVTGKLPDVVHKPGRSLDVPISILDTSRLRRVTGWAPEWSFESGLLNTWKWMQETLAK
jgi:UDP-glucose 4-epimerase